MLEIIENCKLCGNEFDTEGKLTTVCKSCLRKENRNHSAKPVLSEDKKYCDCCSIVFIPKNENTTCPSCKRRNKQVRNKNTEVKINELYIRCCDGCGVKFNTYDKHMILCTSCFEKHKKKMNILNRKSYADDSDKSSASVKKNKVYTDGSYEEPYTVHI